MRQIRSDYTVCMAMLPNGRVQELCPIIRIKEIRKRVSEYKVVRAVRILNGRNIPQAYSRKGFYPYQCVFNVGFRVIIED